MGDLPTERTWVPRLIVIALCIFSVSCQDKENWDTQFAEMKALMNQLDSKMSSFDSKLNNLNILEYAFKVNIIDNSLKNLNSRVDQVTTQLDTIKESLRTLPSSPCLQTERAQSQQAARGSPSNDDKQVVQKLDDYGRKLIQSQEDIKSASQEHHQSLTSFVDVIRSGFAKIITKLDSLLALEGPMSIITPLVRQLSTATTFISEEVSSVATDVTQVKKSIAELTNTNTALPQTVTNLINNEVSKQISEIVTGVQNLTNTNGVLSEAVTEMQNSLAFPVSQLQQAFEEAKGLQSEMARLASIEEKVQKAAALSSNLLSKDSLKSLPAEDREIAESIRTSLSEIANATDPLFLSLTYNFDHIRAVIGDSFATLANRTQCHLDESVKLEIRRLKDGISLLPKPSCQVSDSNVSPSLEVSNSNDVFDYCRETIQDMVISATPNVQMPLLKLLSHLKVLAEVNVNLNAEKTGSQDWDKSLRILHG